MALAYGLTRTAPRRPRGGAASEKGSPAAGLTVGTDLWVETQFRLATHLWRHRFVLPVEVTEAIALACHLFQLMQELLQKRLWTTHLFFIRPRASCSTAAFSVA